jgi:CRP-like cAMP-binding protein/Zn-dependent protease
MRGVSGWGMFVAIVAALLLASAFVGNLFASRRRRTPGVSVPGAVRRRLEAERARGTHVVGPAAGWHGSQLATALASAPEHDEATRNLWEGLAGRVDPAELRPRLAPDVEIKRFSLRWGNDYAMIANPRDLLHYRLEPGEIELLPLMDGTRTVKEIVVERLRQSGDVELPAVADLVRQLRVGNFLETSFLDVEAAVRRAMDPVSAARARAREFAKTLSIEWRGADRLVAWSYRHLLRYFFIPAIGVLALLAASAGGVAFWLLVRSGRFSLSGESAALESLLLLAMSYFLTFMHELGHAVVLTHYGRRVKSAGFMIYFGSPAFFVDSSDGLMMDRGQRMVQSFAGPYAEMVIAGAAAALAWSFPEWSLSPVLYKFAGLNYFVIFLNLVPMLELDGYWILSDLIQVPDLRPRSLQFIRYDLWQKLRRRERFTRQEVGLGVYAFLGVVFTILTLWWSFVVWEEIFGGLIRALWGGGPVGRVLLVALALFVTGPVLRGAIAIARSLIRRGRGVVRAIRFRLQTTWRVEAAELIDALPIFEDLPEEALSDLAGRVHLRSFPRGKSVFRQGDRPEAFYIVRNGVLHVLEEDAETGKERILRTLGRGESFGELGLVDGASRTATVRSVEDSQLFEVDEATFDRLLADMVSVPEFAPTLQAIAELRRIPAFSGLGADDLAEVLEHGDWVNVPPGESIVTQGEKGDVFYAIGSGQVEVLQDGERTATIGPGGYFGEIALLGNVPRTATVLARTPARLFRLDREGFERAIAGAFRRGTLNPSAAIGRTWQH